LGAPSFTTTPTPTLASATAGGDLAFRDQVVDHVRRDHRDVEDFAALDALLQLAGGAVVDRDFVAGLLLEIRH
jgi:hypothetical protein